MKYAEIIVDISTQALDRVYTYIIPKELEDQIQVGCQVKMPFGNGNNERKGYVMNIKTEPGFDLDKLKAITDVTMDAALVEGQLLLLAEWIRENYGSTLVQALMTVLPIKAKIQEKQQKYIKLCKPEEETKAYIEVCRNKKYVAKVRLLEAIVEDHVISKSVMNHTLNVPDSTLKSLIKDGWVEASVVRDYRNPMTQRIEHTKGFTLNEEQQAAVDTFWKDYQAGVRDTYLLYGITGSGKTEVYLDMIEKVLDEGKEAIVLIPEIALTYQTVRRFANRFGNQVTVIHSKLSQGEKYDQFERARKGDVKVVIGPRSALFVPFANLGLIIIDEEHETSYKSESPPKYHARETAIERARLAGASVVLGSATPSVESFMRAKEGQYQMLTLTKRAADAILPSVEIVDLREELKAHNYSMFSRSLKRKLQECINRGEQSMLFINRRGYAGFVSCRKCGYVVKCPHCDVSLKLHGTDQLKCHYCGYEQTFSKVCPECSGVYVKAFGTGTQKIEKQLIEEFDNIKVLRMDADTTKQKGGHEKILQAFANEEANVLVGTQMIVKGHDFPNVTLVASLAADMSLFEQDFRSSERTFDLLTQAAGRAGRGKREGHMIIQTYQPEQYSIVTAAKQDYEAFYEEEVAYRKMLKYPPAEHMLAIFMASDKSEDVAASADQIKRFLMEQTESLEPKPKVIGPSEASVYKVNDVYRKLLYVKHKDYDTLVGIKNQLDAFCRSDAFSHRTRVYFDFDPMTMY